MYIDINDEIIGSNQLFSYCKTFKYGASTWWNNMQPLNHAFEKSLMNELKDDLGKILYHEYTKLYIP